MFGGFGFVWFILWMVLAADSPTTHRFIRDKEREYIEEETREIIESHKAGETVSIIVSDHSPMAKAWFELLILNP